MQLRSRLCKSHGAVYVALALLACSGSKAESAEQQKPATGAAHAAKAGAEPVRSGSVESAPASKAASQAPHNTATPAAPAGARAAAPAGPLGPTKFPDASLNADILGIKLGMTVQQVLDIATSKKAVITAIVSTELDTRTGFPNTKSWPAGKDAQVPWQAVSRLAIDLRALNPDYKTMAEREAFMKVQGYRDDVEVEFAIFPDDNRVIKIQRTAVLRPDEQTSVDLYRKALIEKYGPPTASNEVPDVQNTRVVGFQASWLLPAGAVRCHSGIDRWSLENNLKSTPDACGTTLAFNLAGNPVTTATSFLENPGVILLNKERSAQYVQDWRRQRQEESVKKAVAPPSL